MRSSEKHVPTAQSRWCPGGGRSASSRTWRRCGESGGSSGSAMRLERRDDVGDDLAGLTPAEVELRDAKPIPGAVERLAIRQARQAAFDLPFAVSDQLERCPVTE